MKRYKLLKDLPFAKAGEMFELRLSVRNEQEMREYYNDKGFIAPTNNFDEWFEEVNTFKIPDKFEMEFFTIDYNIEDGFYARSFSSDHYEDEYEDILKHHMKIGLAFETEKEAEKHLEWLKARAVLLEDCGKDRGYWSVKHCWRLDKLLVASTDDLTYNEIIFTTEEDAKKSVEKHEKEWKIYLGVE